MDLSTESCVVSRVVTFLLEFVSQIFWIKTVDDPINHDDTIKCSKLLES